MEIVSVHSSIVNNDYPQDSRVLYTFAPNKPLATLLIISPKNLLFQKTFNFKPLKYGSQIKIVNH